MKSNIIFGKIWNYVSEDTGKIITTGHPAVSINTSDGKFIVFPFSHERHYGIEGKEELYNYSTKSLFSKTTIKAEKELSDTKKYYKSIFENKQKDDFERNRAYKTYRHLAIGYSCYHPIESNKSFLEQEIPTFDSRTDFKFIPSIIDFKKATTQKEYEDVETNIEQFNKSLPLIEKALINNRLYKYEGKVDTIENFLEIQKEKFSVSERINLAWQISNKYASQKGIEKITELEYLDKIISSTKSGRIKSFEVEDLELYKKELSLKELKNDIERSETKISNLKILFQKAINELDADKVGSIDALIKEEETKIKNLKYDEISLSKMIETLKQRNDEQDMLEQDDNDDPCE